MLSAREDQIAVLFVGENTVFTEFTQRCSARDDDSFTVETTMSADKGLEIISDRSPDCVVSACDVPDMGGVGFLEAVRAEYPELPFILSLGDGREDVASEALSAGVTDCFKTRPASEQSELLANRIRNVVLARRETQRAERQEELRYLMERTVPIGGFEIDVETGDISLTDGTGRILDSSEDTSHTLDDWIALFHPTDHSGIRQAIDSTREMGEETGGTWRYQHPDGEERLMDVRFTPETITGDTTMLQGTIRDVTDQRERKHELEQIETLFEQAQDGLFLIDVGEEFTVERVNPALEDAMGVSAERLSGQRIQDIFGEEGARMVANCRQCIEHREPLQYDEQLQIGEHVTEWETRIAPVVLDDTVEYIVGSTRDVTEQREREQELQAEQRFIRQALDALNDVFYVIDVDGRLQRWNAQVPEVTGYSESTLADLNAIDLFPEDEQDTVTEAIDTTVAEGTVTVEIDLLTADGRRIPYEFRATRLTDDDGTTTGIAGIGRDLTERRQRERRFQALVEESHDAITVIGENGEYQYQSPSAERMLGYDVEETIGETVWEYIHPDDRETVRDTFEEWLVNPEETADVVEYRARHADGSWRWMEARANNPADNPAIDGFVINSRDITERKERERILRELHTATQEFYPPSDVPEIAEFLVEFISGAFDFRYVSVKPFDKNENHLQPAVRSSMSGDESGGLGPVEPGPNPIWRAYEQGDPQTFDVAQYFDTLPDTETPANRGLAFPTGDFGVIVVSLPKTGTTDDVDIDLIEVVAAHAESAFQRLHAVETYSDVTEQLATQRAEVEELTHIVDAIQALHGRLAESDSRDALEEMVCEKLVQNDRIDFAWIGRPKGDETNLPPSTWAGQESGYLNTVDPGSGGELLPAQRAARDHNRCSFSDIGANAIDQGWAKKALTAGFRSVLSVPLLHDGVLYGVLSVYSSEEGAFDQTYTDLVRNVGSLLVSYSVTLDTRYADSNETYTVLEFDLTDPAYPFQELAAATDSRIQFDTVVETTETEMKLFITVLDGDPDAVHNQASSVSSITAVEWVGETTRQLSVTVKKPFLASVVGRHGARLHHAVSDSDGTTCRVKLPGHASTRPVVDSLLSEYRDISLVAQRQEPQTDVVDVPQVQDVLTDRQFEVLQAAFYSGYYDTPKNATGEDLAAHFGISSAAVYKHLQAGQRQILEAIFERVDTS